MILRIHVVPVEVHVQTLLALGRSARFEQMRQPVTFVHKPAANALQNGTRHVCAGVIKRRLKLSTLKFLRNSKFADLGRPQRQNCFCPYLRNEAFQRNLSADFDSRWSHITTAALGCPN